MQVINYASSRTEFALLFVISPYRKCRFGSKTDGLDTEKMDKPSKHQQQRQMMAQMMSQANKSLIPPFPYARSMRVCRAPLPSFPYSKLATPSAVADPGGTQRSRPYVYTYMYDYICVRERVQTQRRYS